MKALARFKDQVKSFVYKIFINKVVFIYKLFDDIFRVRFFFFVFVFLVFFFFLGGGGGGGGSCFKISLFPAKNVRCRYILSYVIQPKGRSSEVCPVQMVGRTKSLNQSEDVTFKFGKFWWIMLRLFFRWWTNTDPDCKVSECPKQKAFPVNKCGNQTCVERVGKQCWKSRVCWIPVFLLFVQIFLKFFSTVDYRRSFCEQYRSWSDCTECAVWPLIYIVNIFILDCNLTVCHLAIEVYF